MFLCSIFFLLFPNMSILDTSDNGTSLNGLSFGQIYIEVFTQTIGSKTYSSVTFV